MIVWIALPLALFASLLTLGMDRSEKLRSVLNWAASLSLFVFIVTSASAVMSTLVTGTVFMTEVHRVLLNPFFLTSGAYLGVYGFAKSILLAWRGKS